MVQSHSDSSTPESTLTYARVLVKYTSVSSVQALEGWQRPLRCAMLVLE